MEGVISSVHSGIGIPNRSFIIRRSMGVAFRWLVRISCVQHLLWFLIA